MVLGLVLAHPCVVGELACGTLPAPPMRTLGDMALLLSADQAAPDDLSAFIDQDVMFGLGSDWIELMLLPSTLTTHRAQLLTLVNGLASLSERSGVSWRWLFRLEGRVRLQCWTAHRPARVVS